MSLPLPPALWIALGQGAAGLAYGAVQLAMLFYAVHRAVVLVRWWRGRRRPLAAPAPPAEWPVVTVQLPVYDERRVVERLIDAVAALDYPRERLEIQVLDDSTDDTWTRAAVAVARHRARGIDVVHLRRFGRDGFKAGALAAGLTRARGSLLAVFDADFVPPADFLRRTVPHFSDPRVGMVQARWAHLNRRRSLLTAAQAALLDSHFLLEHRARMASGLFFNFNGTAGLWRRACIEDAGGWSHDTLTEDLDLSYRAQLRGWRFVFDPSVEAPAELPADMEAFKSQQRRWAKGSIQTARKVLPGLLAGPLPARVKLEAFVHLTSNLAYPLLLVLGALLLPVMLDRRMLAPPLAWFVQAGVLAFGVLPVVLFLIAGQRASGAGWARALRDSLAALVLGMGMSVNNARAVCEALGPRLGDWERTPKSGEGGARAVAPGYRAARSATGRAELALALYAAGLCGLALAIRQWRTLPFVLLLLAGFLSVGWASLRDRRSFSRAAESRGRPAAPRGASTNGSGAASIAAPPVVRSATRAG